MENKSKELKVAISNLNDKLHFQGVTGDNAPISIDYIPPLGDSLGYTSLELLLLSLSSCVASTLLIFLRKMNKNIANISANAIGQRKEEHPTGFKTFTFLFVNILNIFCKKNYTYNIGLIGMFHSFS